MSSDLLDLVWPHVTLLDLAWLCVVLRDPACLSLFLSFLFLLHLSLPLLISIPLLYIPPTLVRCTREPQSVICNTDGWSSSYSFLSLSCASLFSFLFTFVSFFLFFLLPSSSFFFLSEGMYTKQYRTKNEKINKINHEYE